MYDKLTKDDIKKIEEEIEFRKLVKRKELIEAVKEARAHGDLSENFEYYAAKREKNQNESRINYLQRMLNTAKVIDDNTRDNQVGVDSRVTVKYLEDQGTETFVLVTNIRGNSLENKISIESPMGKALLGKKTGDIVTIKVNDSFSYDVEIIDLEKNVKDEDDINSF